MTTGICAPRALIELAELTGINSLAPVLDKRSVGYGALLIETLMKRLNEVEGRAN